MVPRILLLLVAVHLVNDHEVSAQEATPPQNLVQPRVINIPLKGAGVFGSTVSMVTHLYKPEGDGPFPVILFSHGIRA